MKNFMLMFLVLSLAFGPSQSTSAGEPTRPVSSGPILLAQNQAGSEASIKAAVDAAQAWLALVDAGQDGKSWEKASELFRGSLTKKQWEGTLELTRKNLGRNVSRKLASTQFTTTLPGAPDGQYVVIEYNSSFEKKKEASEKLVPMMDPDGQWRVSGYFIK